jgi:hypothetical protein
MFKLPDPLVRCKMIFASLTTAPETSKTAPETVAESLYARSVPLAMAHVKINCLNTCLPSLEAWIKIPLLLGAGQGRSSDLQAQIALLLALLPIPVEDSDVWAFVPAYRCGAVLESHQVPFSTRPFR